ncbi:MAG: cytochrome c3 family protein [Desulfobacterales bacterium]
MKGKQLLLLAIAGFAVVFVAAGIQASSGEVADVIKMQNPAYEHTKGIVDFTHKKHSTEYGATCGECHHDENGKPLADLKEGDPVQGCIECHKNPGEATKDDKKAWKEKKLSRDEVKKLELEYHAEAIHENCQGCHKEYNKKNNTKAAPTTCTKCHPKEG